MEDLLDAKASSRPVPASRPGPQRLLVCTECRHRAMPCLPGLALLDRLQRAVATARPGADFEVSGTACLETCNRACTVAWRATPTGCWLFGDVTPEASVDALIAQGSTEGSGAAAVIVTGLAPLH